MGLNILTAKILEPLEANILKIKQKPDVVPIILRILKYLKDKYRLVRLFANIIYINGLSFLHAISDKIQFKIVSHLNSEGKPSLAKAILEVIKVYYSSRFKIEFIKTNSQFNLLVNSFNNKEVEILDLLDYVNIIECSIQSAKKEYSILQYLYYSIT